MRARIGERNWRPRGRRPAGSARPAAPGSRPSGVPWPSGSPTATELVASVGLDWIIIESDHYGTDSADIQALLMASARTGTVPLVRVPPHDLTRSRRPSTSVRSASWSRWWAAPRRPRASSRRRGTRRAARAASGRCAAARTTSTPGGYLDDIAESLLVWLILETLGAVRTSSASPRRASTASSSGRATSRSPTASTRSPTTRRSRTSAVGRSRWPPHRPGGRHQRRDARGLASAVPRATR